MRNFKLAFWVFLLLFSQVWADGIGQVMNAPPSLGLPKGVQVVAVKELGIFLDVYPTPGKSSEETIDIYSNHRRVARHRLANQSFKAKEVELHYLDQKRKKGLVLVHWSGYSGFEMNVMVLGEPWQAPVQPQLFTKCEFSTTGWNDLHLGRNDKTGLARVVEEHFSPGEETEQGRKTDVSTDYFEWNPKKRQFIKVP